MRLTHVLTIPFVLAGCQQAETAQQADARIEAESKAARPELEAITAKLAGYFDSGAVDSAAARITDDYRFQPPNAPAQSGRPAFVAVVKGMLATGKLHQTYAVESVVANGPIAIQTGRVTQEFTPGPGAPKGAKVAVDTGKYMWMWRKESGGWRLAVASWNSNLPAKP